MTMWNVCEIVICFCILDSFCFWWWNRIQTKKAHGEWGVTYLMFSERLNKPNRNKLAPHLARTWGHCSLHWVPDLTHGEPQFGSPRQTHRPQEESVAVGLSQSTNSRTLGCSWLIVWFYTCLNQKKFLQGLSTLWNGSRSAPVIISYSNPLKM